MKNPENIETVDKVKHAKLRINHSPVFAHAKALNLSGVLMGELSAAVCNFPIVFITNPESKQLRPVAMLGLRPGENVFYGDEAWDSTYVPMMIQRHPFIIGFDDRIEDEKQLATCLVRKSAYVSESDGIAMFSDTGEETDYLKSRHLMMRDIFEGEKYLEQFTHKLQELDLLTPIELIVQPEAGEPRRITGMATINDERLKALSAAQVQELYMLGFLPACYMIMASVFQLHKLMQLRNRKVDEKVTEYRIEIGVPPQQPAAA